MKKLVIALFMFSAFAHASVIEGQLISKLKGELDPYVLGEGCLSIVEYYEAKKDDFIRIGIYEADTDACLSDDTFENEEIDFDPEQLKPVKNKKKLSVLKDLAKNVLGEKDSLNFFEL